LDLPTVAVHDLIVKNDDLVVGTMGRSIFILDDLTPVRQMKTGALYPPRSIYRWRTFGAITVPGDRSAGDNPPKGATIYYHLAKRPAKATLEILDTAGKRVTLFESKEKEEKKDETLSEEAPPKPKKLNLPVEKGLNRVVWDLT